MEDQSLKSKTKKGLYWKFAEQFSNYGIQFIIGIAMARMLSPEDYGITALPAVFMAVAGVFVGGGFSDALVRKQDMTEEDLSTAFYYSLSVGAFFYVVLFFGSPWIADFYNVPILTPLMRVTALSFLYSPLGTPQYIILKRRLDFKTPAKISVVTKIVVGLTGLILAYTGYGVWALVISGLVGGILDKIIIISLVRWLPKTGWSRESFRYLWGYGNKMMVSALLDQVYGNITPVIVGKFFSPADLGVYNRAHGYAAMPSKNIHAVVREVTFPVLSKLQDEPERLVANYRRMIKVSGFVVFPLMLLLSALSRPIIITMITVKWEACIILLQIICFSMMWYPIHALNLNILMIRGRSDLFLKLEITKKALGLIVMCIFLPMGLIAFCAAGIGSSLVSLFINTWYTGQFYKFGFKEQIRDLLPSLTISFTMFLVVLALTHVIGNMIFQIVIGVLVGAIIYLGGAYVMKFQELHDVKYLLSRKKNKQWSIIIQNQTKNTR